MSRSYRHNNFVSNTCCGYDSSEKEDKQRANRKLRSKSKIAINNSINDPDSVMLPDIREVDEKYTWKKEGKQLVNPKRRQYSRDMHFTKDGKLRK